MTQTYTEGIGRIINHIGPDIPAWQRKLTGDLFSAANTEVGYTMRLAEGECVEWETQDVQYTCDHILIAFPMALGMGRNGLMFSGEFVLSANGQEVIEFRAVKYSTLWEKDDCRFYYEVKRKMTEPETVTAGMGYLLLPSTFAEEGSTLNLAVRNRKKTDTFRARGGFSEKWFRLDSYDNCFHQNGLTKACYQIHLDNGIAAVLTGRPPRTTWGERTLLFGDLHAHSGRLEARYDEGEREFLHANVCNCGIKTPDDYMNYARYVSMLDFFCITDHCRAPGFFTERDWQHRLDVNDHWHEAPEFITLPGVELVTKDGGHWNLYFREQHPAYPPTEDLQLVGIQEALRQRTDKFMLVPHQTPTYCLAPINWDLFVQQHSPIVEIFSHWGSGEYFGNPLQCREVDVNPNSFIDVALRRGYKMGFIGSTDEHAAAPGDGATYYNPLGAGLACVWANDLTREGVFDALESRHCFATTGVRMDLRFSFNDTPMGQSVAMRQLGDKRVLRVQVDAPETVDEIVLMKNSEEVAFIAGRKPQMAWEWADETDPPQPGDYYYPRVTLKDGETAWASPIWIDQA